MAFRCMRDEIVIDGFLLKTSGRFEVDVGLSVWLLSVVHCVN
uniref:Uncharacterized protein n=1 Tax=Arundo donax TaxID=35708 RepID=A0A0A9AFS5_ARUDO